MRKGALYVASTACNAQARSILAGLGWSEGELEAVVPPRFCVQNSRTETRMLAQGFGGVASATYTRCCDVMMLFRGPACVVVLLMTACRATHL